MSQLIESIWIKNHKRQNLAYHQARIEHAFKHYLKAECHINLNKIIDNRALNDDDIKCRLIYDSFSCQIEYHKYERKQIQFLQLVYDDDISYSFKTLKRELLDNLFLQKGRADEIIIIKNMLVTDAYYFNLVFEKNNSFFTPDSCLLCGIMRQNLLNKSIIGTKRIKLSDIKQFEKVHLINALNGIGTLTVATENILFGN